MGYATEWFVIDVGLSDTVVPDRNEVLQPDSSVGYHCILENGVMTVDDCFCDRFNLEPLADCIYYFASERYNRFIANIYFENMAGVFEGLKGLIIKHAPSARWNVQPIPIDRTLNAKVRRIGRIEPAIKSGIIRVRLESPHRERLE